MGGGGGGGGGSTFYLNKTRKKTPLNAISDAQF